MADLQHSQSASALSRESGFVLESPTVTAFRNGVLEGKWETVVRLLQDEDIVQGVDVSVRNSTDQPNMRPQFIPFPRC